MQDDKLVKKFMENIINIKKSNIKNIIEHDDFTHNQIMILFLIHDLQEEGKVSLMEIRKKIKLAPSTITPIIASLERENLIERNIDENDRRNIYIKLSKKGEIYTKKIHEEMIKKTKEYIEYMGKKDILKLIELIEKSTKFFYERRIINEKNI